MAKRKQLRALRAKIPSIYRQIIIDVCHVTSTNADRIEDQMRELYGVLDSMVKEDFDYRAKQAMKDLKIKAEPLGRIWPQCGPHCDPGVRIIVAALKDLVAAGRQVMEGSIISMCRNRKDLKVPMPIIRDALQMLEQDEVLVDKDRDGRLRIDMSKLEERMEIYNMTP